jgi:hypothetical protein
MTQFPHSFRAYDFDTSAEWKEYLNRVEITSTNYDAVLKLKLKWFHKNQVRPGLSGSSRNQFTRHPAFQNRWLPVRACRIHLWTSPPLSKPAATPAAPDQLPGRTPNALRGMLELKEQVANLQPTYLPSLALCSFVRPASCGRVDPPSNRQSPNHQTCMHDSLPLWRPHS